MCGGDWLTQSIATQPPAITLRDGRVLTYMESKIELAWMDIAFAFASRMSKDPRTQVGAVIVSPDHRHFSVGYNGFPSGVCEDSHLWEAPEKYERVIHAEVNALLNCPFDTKGCKVYCTHEPCHRCHGAMINAGIVEVVYAQPYMRNPRRDITREFSARLPIRQLDYPIPPSV